LKVVAERNMSSRLEDILKRAVQEEDISREEVAFLLNVADNEKRERIFETARELRRRFFGDRVFLYGFLYLSTYCRNDCRFCYYRRSNSMSVRYRRSRTEILAAAKAMALAGVHLIDLTMGEDPVMLSDKHDHHQRLLRLVSELRQACRLPLMISPGAVPDALFEDLVQAGASWYACYQETFNQRLFGLLRPGQSYGGRLRKKQAALLNGLLVEEGLLCGVGESAADLAHAIIEMGRSGASQMRAMTFVPQPGTPMAAELPPDRRLEPLLIAAMRLAHPRVLIPASLDVEGLDGLAPRLNAGANVVTSIVPPGMGLAGVAHPTLDIESARRTPDRIDAVLSDCRLKTASAEQYRAWLDVEREKRLSVLADRSRTCA
jgi:methylornithine synthase